MKSLLKPKSLTCKKLSKKSHMRFTQVSSSLENGSTRAAGSIKPFVTTVCIFQFWQTNWCVWGGQRLGCVIGKMVFHWMRNCLICIKCAPLVTDFSREGKTCLLKDPLIPPENLMKALAFGNIRESQWASWLRFWCFFTFAVMWKSIYIPLFFFIYWHILAISEKGYWTIVGWSDSSIWRIQSWVITFK